MQCLPVGTRLARLVLELIGGLDNNVSRTSSHAATLKFNPGVHINYVQRSVPGQSVTNAQVTTLSHEIFETITDPDPNAQWTNLNFGEIGDTCSIAEGAALFHNPEVYSVPICAQKYNVQLEYSNKSFGCRASQ